MTPDCWICSSLIFFFNIKLNKKESDLSKKVPNFLIFLDLVILNVFCYLIYCFTISFSNINDICSLFVKEIRICIYFFETVGVIEFKTNSLVVFSDLIQNIVDTSVDLHGNLLTQIGTFDSMIIFWFLCIILQHCLNSFIR